MSFEEGAVSERLTEGRLPDVLMQASDGSRARLLGLAGARSVIYLYPGDGAEAPYPPKAPPSSCAVQRAGFRDLTLDFAALGVRILGISSEPHELQRSVTRAEQLPFALLSDSEMQLAKALRLPTFDDRGVGRYRRITLIAEAERIAAAFYPVSPKRSASQALAWLELGARY